MRGIFEYPVREMIPIPSCRCPEALQQSIDNFKVVFALNDRKSNRAARTLPLDPRPKSREGRTTDEGTIIDDARFADLATGE
jgi:hypothetical protein